MSEHAATAEVVQVGDNKAATWNVVDGSQRLCISAIAPVWDS